MAQDMTEEDFIKLGAHLKQLDPCVEEFCRKHSFERIVGSSIGRYPRIRVERSDTITLWIDLWMCLDDDGQRFSLFSPDLPYELSAGAYFDEPSEDATQWRYQHCFAIWSAKPFKEVAEALPEALEKAVAILQQWDLSLLQKEGLRLQLAGPGNSNESTGKESTGCSSFRN